MKKKRIEDVTIATCSRKSRKKRKHWERLAKENGNAANLGGKKQYKITLVSYA